MYVNINDVIPLLKKYGMGKNSKLLSELQTLPQVNFERFYFTLGSSKTFPYQEAYLIVLAKDINEATYKFRQKYPDNTPGIINCAFIYTDEQWNKSLNSNHYKEPVEYIY